jgi:hypothetical protein
MGNFNSLTGFSPSFANDLKKDETGKSAPSNALNVAGFFYLF